MQASFHASGAAARPAAVGRRDFARCLAAAWLSVSTSQVVGQPRVGFDPVPAGLRRAQRSFDEIAHAASLLDLDVRAGFVNVEVNRRLEYESDPPSVPGGDVWSTPYETLARGAGDCEDFAITKFFLLVASGAPRQGVRLLYARYRWPDLMAPPVPHLVAIARWPWGDPWVLDCIDPLQVALSQRDDLEAVFSFDQASVWPQVGEEPLPSGRSRIHRWRMTQVRTRLQSQQQFQGDRRSSCPTSTEARMARSKVCIDRRRSMPPSSSALQTPTYSGS